MVILIIGVSGALERKVAIAMDASRLSTSTGRTDFI